MSGHVHHCRLLSTFIVEAMERTSAQTETARRRAETFERNVVGDEDRADEFADMDVEDYAELRGIEIVENPNKRRRIMAAKTNAQLRRELREANDRIAELEQEKADVIDALGLEVNEDEEDEEDEEEEEEPLLQEVDEDGEPEPAASARNGKRRVTVKIR